jgi:hypothetical protein
MTMADCSHSDEDLLEMLEREQDDNAMLQNTIEACKTLIKQWRETGKCGNGSVVTDKYVTDACADALEQALYGCKYCGVLVGKHHKICTKPPYYG